MSSKSDYLEDAILNAVLRNITFTSPLQVYAALYTAIADGEADSNTEVTGAGYARVSASFAAPTPTGSTANSSAILFPQATADYPADVMGFGVYDAVSAGNLLYWGVLGNPGPQNFTAEESTDLFYAPSHSFAENDRVRFESTPAGDLPTGVTANTDYYISGSATDTFYVSATTGPSSSVDLTVDGSGVVARIKARTVQQDDTIQFDSGSLIVKES